MKRVADFKGLPIYEFDIGDRVVTRSKKEQILLTGIPHNGMGKSRFSEVFKILNAKYCEDENKGNFVNADDGILGFSFSCRYLPYVICGQKETLE